MTIIFGIFIFGVVCVIAGLTASKKKPKPIIIFDQYSPKGKIWMLHMWKLFRSGGTWEDLGRMHEAFERMFNITLPVNAFGTKVEAYRKELGIVDDFTSVVNEKDIEYQKGDFEFWLSTNLAMRWNYQYKPLKDKSETEAMKEDNLKIHPKEVLYYNCSNIDWYEPVDAGARIKRDGHRFGPAGTMSFLTGGFPPVENSFIGYQVLERGSLYITNRRIIFVCSNSLQSRTMDLDDIPGFNIYKDGILLGKSQGPKPLIVVPDYVNNLVPRDDFNLMIRVLYRVMSSTAYIDHTLVTNHQYSKSVGEDS
jgi:hypothetical protein